MKHSQQVSELPAALANVSEIPPAETDLETVSSGNQTETELLRCHQLRRPVFSNELWNNFSPSPPLASSFPPSTLCLSPYIRWNVFLSEAAIAFPIYGDGKRILQIRIVVPPPRFCLPVCSFDLIVVCIIIIF